MSVRARVVFNNFPAIKAGMLMNAEAITGKAALDLEGQMKARVPVDTGFLKSSIQARKVGPAHWRVTVGAEYGLFVEYGTRFMGAQPYFYPAVAVVGPQFIAAMRRITA